MSAAPVTAASLQQELETTDWRVHETGRVQHWMVDGLAHCGEPGAGWRVVPGIPCCAACAASLRGDPGGQRWARAGTEAGELSTEGTEPPAED